MSCSFVLRVLEAQDSIGAGHRFSGFVSVRVPLFRKDCWVGAKPRERGLGPLEIDPEAGKQGVGEEVRRAGVGEHRGLHGHSCSGELSEE